MSDSPYAEALQDWDPLATTLHQAYHPASANLPAVVPAQVVHQPVPLPERAPRVDLVSVRLLAGGGCVALAGLGVDLAGHGIRVAGPYLWALAGVLGALAAVIALLKGKTGAPSTGQQVTISGGRNRIGRIG